MWSSWRFHALRDAFYGGRTETFKLYEETGLGNQRKYYDVTSLYPFVNKIGKIPLGHPKIIRENFDSGLVKCKILPPKGLKRFTFLFYLHCNGKLIFSLCRSCSETYQQTECKHLDKERTFVGTWVTDEIKEALSLGYKILGIYEVWHFSKISQYDPTTKTGGVFTQYVNTFLNIRGLFKICVDFCWRIKTDSYAVMKFISILYLSSINSEKFMYLAWICVELWLIEDTHHRCPGARQWRSIYFAFHSVTIPLTCSQITRCQVKKTDDGVSVTDRLFILTFRSNKLHLSAVQTPFQGVHGPHPLN